MLKEEKVSYNTKLIDSSIKFIVLPHSVFPMMAVTITHTAALFLLIPFISMMAPLHAVPLRIVFA